MIIKKYKIQYYKWINIPNLNPLSLFTSVSTGGFTDSAHNPTGGVGLVVISSGTSIGVTVVCRMGASMLMSISSLRGGFGFTILELLKLKKIMFTWFYLIILSYLCYWILVH